MLDVWEHRAAVARLREAGRAQVDEHAPPGDPWLQDVREVRYYRKASTGQPQRLNANPGSLALRALARESTNDSAADGQHPWVRACVRAKPINRSCTGAQIGLDPDERFVVFAIADTSRREVKAITAAAPASPSRS